MPETTPLIKAALNLRVGAGFDVYRLNSLKIENIPIHTEINMIYSSSIVVFDTAVHVLK